MTRAVLFLLLAVPAAASDYALPAPPPGPRVDYSAETVEFDSGRSSLHLSTGVVLKESTWTVKGQDIWVDTARRVGRSDGPILMEDGVSAVYGDAGEFDFVKHTGRLYRSSSGHADWRIHARRAELGEGRRLEYRGADFTSCSAVPPDYHFHASSVSVIPKKRILAKNVLFYLGPVPIFYMPFLYKSLKPDHLLRWRTQPGLDGRNGPYVKNTLITSHSDSVYSKLFADYYARQGFGYGGELNRRKGEDSRAVLYGYRIKETSTWDSDGANNTRIVTSTQVARWQVLGDLYQALGSSNSLQGRLQTQSDADFNNHYSRSSSLRVTPDLFNSAAFVHRFSQATARLSWSRYDVADDTRRKYFKTTESIPRLDVNSSSLRIGRLPWLNTFNGFADSTYVRGRTYLEKSVGAGWQGTRNFQLARGVSLTPSLSYNETYYNRMATSGAPIFDALIGRWNANGTLRFDTPLGGLDATHAYQQRLKHGTLQHDAGAVDKGVEINAVTLSDVYVLNPRAWTRLSSGYDFRTYRDHSVGFRQRVQPITAEVNWQASEKLVFTFHEDYQLDEGNRAFLADIHWGDDEGNAAGGSVFHNDSDPTLYYGSLNFAVAPSSPTWRVAAGVHALAVCNGGAGGLRRGRIFDKELSWTKRWHDFYTKLSGRVRTGGVKEVAIRIDMKFGSADPKRAPRRDWEAEWFPERAGTDEFRP